MGEIDVFMAYAADFEKTCADDDWSRLERHFTDDAVYEVVEPVFAARVEGPRAMLAAMRKSVDGFDRRCDERRIALRGEPKLSDGELVIPWTVTYVKSGAPDFALDGESVARFEGDRIAYLSDRFPEGMGDRTQAWIRDHAPGLDFSYT